MVIIIIIIIIIIEEVVVFAEAAYTGIVNILAVTSTTQEPHTIIKLNRTKPTF